MVPSRVVKGEGGLAGVSAIGLGQGRHEVDRVLGWIGNSAAKVGLKLIPDDDDLFFGKGFWHDAGGGRLFRGLPSFRHLCA